MQNQDEIRYFVLAWTSGANMCYYLLITAEYYPLLSVIMNACIAADHTSPMYQYKSGGALCIFFYKLCRYLCQGPTSVIFVLNGPRRPAFKRGAHINTQTVPEWAPICQQIIEAFGFHWHQVRPHSINLPLLVQ